MPRPVRLGRLAVAMSVRGAAVAECRIDPRPVNRTLNSTGRVTASRRLAKSSVAVAEATPGAGRLIAIRELLAAARGA